MKPLYTQGEYNSAKSHDLLPCKCYYCETTFLIKKYVIYKIINNQGNNSGKFCSKSCSSNNRQTRVKVNCKNCNSEFEKIPAEIKRNNNHFCSKSCSTTYHNNNKTIGIHRSKLEQWLEKELTNLYPDLEIHYNQKSAIGSELDIFIPSLNIAFELNGIFHYEPIYGINKLEKTKNNDISKSKACFDAKIDLCIIDTRNQNYFKESSSKIYLDIIINIIKERN